ncbi:MAG: acyl-CoA dehydrogenase family protein [Saprospirales bacterium]|nr:acyl-CoA dehydrogenase family protein [Saprospirales bacterium]MBK8489327.1 acyl-CoA dehydrogenase family protein [Saprospirales bacterium]
MPDTLVHKPLKGGEFLVKDTSPESTFIPEEFSEEQLMIQQMASDFMDNEIYPKREQIENKEPGLTPSLLERAGELGLLGAHMPEEYGGMALETNTNTLIGEVLGPSGSWIVSFAAHTGIGMLPILYYGTEAQKQKYLPKLVTGEWKSAYALTEPGSGSDAMGAKTRADLSPDGKNYILNGQKMWITNAGFADLFIVFAQVGGDKFTGFLVERTTPGLTFGEEEHKLGIHGSSTRMVFLENVQIPAENVLGEIGRGHLIAFNSLNIGRFKLGAMTIGGSKKSITTAVQYANERIQFKKPIAQFGAIQYKLAEQVIRLFAAESALYRTSNLMQVMEQHLHSEGDSFGDAKRKAAQEYAIECAILKVVGSEVLDYVVDETVQIHGGMGYSEEASPARAYRDARINRIFEGTNEINRMLSVDMLLKRAMKGELDIVGPAWEVQKELASMPSMDRPDGLYAEEKKAVKEFKKAVLMTAGAAAKLQMDGQLNLEEEQEILMNVADMLFEAFVSESLLLRVEKLHDMPGKAAEQDLYEAMLQVYLHDATSRMTRFGTDALASFAEGDLLRTLLMGLKRFTKYPAKNVKQLRRKIAARLVEANEYCF